MTSGFDWVAHYNNLPYQFPLLQQFPVVRVPVAGPEPFNTLAVVRGYAGVGPLAYADGHFHAEHRDTVPMGFILAGNDDERLKPVSAHSSTGVLQHMQQDTGGLFDGDSPFVHAVDAVYDGRFEYIGGRWEWCVAYNSDWMADNVYAASTLYISSWVLCYEPRPDPDYPTADGHDIHAQIWRPFAQSSEHLDVPLGTRDGPGSRPYRRRRRRVPDQDRAQAQPDRPG